MNHQGILIAPRFGFAYDVAGDRKSARERALLLDVARKQVNAAFGTLTSARSPRIGQTRSGSRSNTP